MWRQVSCLSLLALSLSCGPSVEPAHLLYEQDAQSLDNPFPDLRLLDDAGFHPRANWFSPFLLRKAQGGDMRRFLSKWADASGEISSVGGYSATLLRPSEPLDPSSLEGTAVRLRRGAAGYEVLEADVSVQHSRSWLEAEGRAVPDDYPEFIFVRPRVALPEGEEGLLVIRAGLRTREGRRLGRGAAFAADKKNEELVAAAAKALGVKGEEVLLALPQRAGTYTPVMQKLAGWAHAQAPSFQIPPHDIITEADGSRRPVGVWRPSDQDWPQLQTWLNRWPWARPADKVGLVVIGTFRTRDLREDGVWKKAYVDNPQGAPTVQLPFVLALPSGPKPPGGYRVVIASHGISARNIPILGNPDAFCLESAQAFASSGLGCIGIDATSHGLRGNSVEFFAIDNLAVARDNLRQMAFDLWQLSALTSTLDVDGDQVADLSPELDLFGNSLGGVFGANFLPFDPRVRSGVLNVAGAGLANVLASHDLRDRIGLLVVARTGIAFDSPEYHSMFPVLRAYGQLFLESGDPVNLAPAFPAEKALLVQEAVDDWTMPNEATEDLARAFGAEPVTTGASGATPMRVLFRADATAHVAPEKLPTYNSHSLFFDIAPARARVVRFNLTHGRELLGE